MLADTIFKNKRHMLSEVTLWTQSNRQKTRKSTKEKMAIRKWLNPVVAAIAAAEKDLIFRILYS